MYLEVRAVVSRTKDHGIQPVRLQRYLTDAQKHQKQGALTEKNHTMFQKAKGMIPKHISATRWQLDAFIIRRPHIQIVKQPFTTFAYFNMHTTRQPIDPHLTANQAKNRGARKHHLCSGARYTESSSVYTSGPLYQRWTVHDKLANTRILCTNYKLDSPTKWRAAIPSTAAFSRMGKGRPMHKNRIETALTYSPSDTLQKRDTQ